jgi:hypothetical protein
MTMLSPIIDTHLHPIRRTRPRYPWLAAVLRLHHASAALPDVEVLSQHVMSQRFETFSSTLTVFLRTRRRRKRPHQSGRDRFQWFRFINPPCLPACRSCRC